MEWLSAGRLLAHWYAAEPAPGVEVLASYVIDANTNALQELKPVRIDGELVTRADGQQAVLLRDFSFDKTPQVSLLDLQTGERQTMWALDPAQSQWTAPADRGWQFGTVSATLIAVWVGQDNVVLTAVPSNDSNFYEWGKLLLANTRTHSVRVLAERGRLMAVLPDGDLLLQRGWIDDGLELLAAPYDGAIEQLTSAGPWLWDAVVSPDGEKVAWWELDPPPGDWSQRLPQGCCSGDPSPVVHHLAIWNRSTMEINRLPVKDAWWRQKRLYWRANSTTLLYSGSPAGETEATGLFEIALDGKREMLARFGWPNPISIDAELPDGSLYYQISGRRSHNDTMLVRSAPDGSETILREGLPFDYYFVDGRLVSTTGSLTVVEELGSGASWQFDVPKDAGLLAPDARLMAVSESERVLRISIGK